MLNTVVYCVPARWIWGPGGFLSELGVIDIAGSGAVHLLGGVSGKQHPPTELFPVKCFQTIVPRELFPAIGELFNNLSNDLHDRFCCGLDARAKIGKI